MKRFFLMLWCIFSLADLVIAQTGRDGRDGHDGKVGRDGRDGRDGKDGRDAVVPAPIAPVAAVPPMIPGNNQPVFISGATISIQVCEGATIKLDKYLQIIDPDKNQNEQFQIAPIAGGSIRGSIGTGSSVLSGINVSPSGWNYTAPSAGAQDILNVTVNDNSGGISQLKITVNINALPAKPLVQLTPSKMPTSKAIKATISQVKGETYTWSPSTGLSSTQGNEVVVKPDVITTYIVTSIDANGCSSKYSFPIRPSIKGSFYVSIGAFISPIRDTTYSWQQLPSNGNNITNTSNYVLTQSGFTPLPVGICVLGNKDFGRKHKEIVAKSEFRFVLSSGVGLTLINRAQLVGLLGCGISVGKLAFNVGGAVTAVNKLTNNLQAVYEQQIEYSSAQNVSYYKELKAGGYFSVSYAINK